MYFQFRCFPSATHCRVVLSRSARVSGRFASVIHSMYSRRQLGLKPSHSALALALFLSPAARSEGTLIGLRVARLARGAEAPASRSLIASFTYLRITRFGGRSLREVRRPNCPIASSVF